MGDPPSEIKGVRKNIILPPGSNLKQIRISTKKYNLCLPHLLYPINMVTNKKPLTCKAILRFINGGYCL